MAVSFELNGSPVTIEEGSDAGERMSLLDALRGPCGITSAKDGCAPQGQCGCCTVLVDGRARVACVTPLRRVGGRRVTTVEGLDGAVAELWSDAFVANGGSQCGFCTPGIVMRLEDRRRREADHGDADRGIERSTIHKALQAHLCRCTGWQGITEAAVKVLGAANFGVGTADARSAGEVDENQVACAGGGAASLRAAIETAGPQRINADVVLGAGGFAADTAPEKCLVAMIGADGNWVVAESVSEARHLSGKVQGRKTAALPEPPLSVPEGDWVAHLITSWVEPAYLETDASWCVPGGEPHTPLANGGAFGAKLTSPLPSEARKLADRHGRPVLVLWSREDSVRAGPKRPPVAGGIAGDGSGVLRAIATPGLAEVVAMAAPRLALDQVESPGPLTDISIRGAGWVEALMLMVAAGVESPLGGRDGSGFRVTAPGEGWARVELTDDGFEVLLGPGDPLDETVLGSYSAGACHMAAGWVTSEALTVDKDGEVQDLTIRSFGVLPAAEMPTVRTVVDAEGSQGDPVAVGAAVFAAAAVAVWVRHGCHPGLPTGAPVLSGGPVEKG